MENKENQVQSLANSEDNASYNEHQKETMNNNILSSMMKNCFNPNAEPFKPRSRGKFITVGPTKISVNAEIWDAIATDHDHTHRLNPTPPINLVFNTMNNAESSSATNPLSYTEISQLLPSSPAFEIDNSRHFVFKRTYGPVATPEGVELRLRFDVRVLMTIDQSVLVENGAIRIAVNPKTNSCALDHPNGKIYKTADHINLITYDGNQRNNHIRIGKIWNDCIAFTSAGCALTYLVDSAGVRTTSEAVIRDWSRDFCKPVFLDDIQIPDEATRNHAATDYHYKVEKDGTETFKICGLRVSQAKDGMLRIQNNIIGIRTSVENRSVTMQLNGFHSTASLGKTPHMFIRHNERRVHFDGINFVVRNQGHSASFDEDNLLRIH
ncbi:hypothetical protein PVAND_008055 [Polypedilum vanderplanki]|uniref:Uncharacterized protein n=1 Tax=Polypedilum vanderplanki TaxID=319348 RepID=A0A9J6C8W5_POLVA|nr:hypothetical protein PVAND_008055 [Polypedilum vanderplanki]